MNAPFYRGLKLFTLVVFVIVLGLAACTQTSPEVPSAPVSLKIAVLPILDNLPMYVAEQEGYFSANGVEVEFIPVGSAAERDQVMAARQADGMINDIVSTLFYNRSAIEIQVVRFARTATENFPQFRILAAKDSGLSTPADLKGVAVGVSEATVIEYLTDRLLEAEGLLPGEIETVSVPGIGERMALLNSGELKAAMLPDPLSSLAIQNGAVVILDDTRHPELGYSLISFRKQVIDDNPQAIRGFLAAVEQAVGEINQDPARWDTLLTERKLVPEPLIGSYQVPVFPTAGVPSLEQFEDGLAWAREEGLIDREVSYADSVNASLLP